MILQELRLNAPSLIPRQVPMFRATNKYVAKSSGVQRGVNWATAQFIQGRGHPKSEMNKNYTLLQFCKSVFLKVFQGPNSGP